METFDLFAESRVPATIIHVVSVVVGMGAALLSDILFNFYAKDKRLNKTERSTLEIISRIVWISLVVIAVSGMFVFMSDPVKYLLSDKFLAKMTILGVLLINGFVLNAYVWKRLSRPGFFTAKRESGTRKIAFAGGAVSVVSWLSVCALGVMDSALVSYIVIMGIYVGIVVFGILTALFMENREFEQSKT
jgi:predicted outer membrane lipoprotein